MTAAKEFLHAEEIGKRIVRRTLDISRIGPAIGDIGRVSPALFCQTTVIGIHATEYIVAVGSREREMLASSHSSRTEVVIIRSGDTRIRKVVRLERQCRLHAACLLVETSYERIAKLSRLHVVDRRAVDIHFVILLVERPITEPHRREQIPHFRGIHIRARGDNGDVLSHVLVLTQLRFCEGERCLTDVGRIALRERQRGIAHGHHG